MSEQWLPTGSDQQDSADAMAESLYSEDDINEAVAQSKQAIKYRVDALLDVIGECTCSVEYTNRNLCDPSCVYHWCKSAIVPLKKAMEN